MNTNNFQAANKRLNELLKKKKPKTFNPGWIKKYSPNLYKALWKNFQSGTEEIDWDLVTAKLDPSFQKRWKLGKMCNIGIHKPYALCSSDRVAVKNPLNHIGFFIHKVCP